LLDHGCGIIQKPNQGKEDGKGGYVQTPHHPHLVSLPTQQRVAGHWAFYLPFRSRAPLAFSLFMDAVFDSAPSPLVAPMNLQSRMQAHHTLSFSLSPSVLLALTYTTSSSNSTQNHLLLLPAHKVGFEVEIGAHGVGVDC